MKGNCAGIQRLEKRFREKKDLNKKYKMWILIFTSAYHVSVNTFWQLFLTSSNNKLWLGYFENVRGTYVIFNDPTNVRVHLENDLYWLVKSEQVLIKLHNIRWSQFDPNSLNLSEKHLHSLRTKRTKHHQQSQFGFPREKLYDVHEWHSLRVRKWSLQCGSLVRCHCTSLNRSPEWPTDAVQYPIIKLNKFH